MKRFYKKIIDKKDGSAELDELVNKVALYFGVED